MVGRDYQEPTLRMPDAWYQQATEGLADGQANLQTWWTVLNDAVLDNLIQRAGAGNLTLKQAVSRIDEAAASRGISRGAYLPSLDGNWGYSRQMNSKDFQVGPSRTFDFNTIGLGASWELDFFGRIRRSVESATASLQSSVEDYRDTLVVLYAQVALAYVEVRTFQLRIKYNEQNISRQKSTMGLTVDRNRAGLVGDLDVRQAELNLATTQALLPQLQQGLVFSVNRLGVLLGLPPEALHAQLAKPGDIPPPPATVLVGQPADLVRQRPDIRSAERQLAAQTAQIGVATADLYPRFSINGSFFYDANDISRLFSSNTGGLNIGPSFQWNIFDGGRIRNAIKVENARTEQALLNYEQTVLLALEEVENATVAYVQERIRRDALNRSVVAAQQSVDLVMTLYRTGLTDFQNVLDTESRLFVQQDDLAGSEGLVTRNLVQIYRALGGGWTPPPAAGTATTPGPVTAPGAEKPVKPGAPGTPGSPGTPGAPVMPPGSIAPIQTSSALSARSAGASVGS
jgi:NodT family efflux transporter outer membrane factor (OMF) lipoprotein